MVGPNPPDLHSGRHLAWLLHGKPPVTCIWHGEWPVIPNRIPLIIKPKRWTLPDGFPGIWIQKLIPLMPFPSSCASIDETLVPSSDVGPGDYAPDPAGGALATHLALNGNDIDTVIFASFLAGFAAQNECTATTSVASFEVHFGNPSGVPGPSDCQGLRWIVRQRKLDSGGTWFPGKVDVSQVQLRETTTQRDSFDFGVLGTSYVTTTRTLTDGEYDNIGNHDNMRLRYNTVDTCADTAFDGGPTLQIAWAKLEYFTK